MRIRVVTYNIHKGIGGLDRSYRPERVRDVLAPLEPDFVLLQEVDEGAARSRLHRQVDLLGDFLGLRHRSFFPNVRLRQGGHYGNAILSRFPLTETRNVDLTVRFSKRRSALHARFRVRRPASGRASRTVHVYDFHLGLSQILRRLQIRKFLASAPFAHLHPRTPVILGGDFNDLWGTLGTKFLAPAGFRGPIRPIPTFPAWAPIWALDAIYVRGDAEILDQHAARSDLSRWASDHRPVVSDIRLT